MMKNLNIKLSILCLLLVSVLSFDTEFFWFAANLTSLNVFRGLLIVLLVILLVTDPPRNKYLRVTLAVASLSTLWWTMTSTIGVDMMLGDWMSLLLASITLGHSALELSSSKKPRKLANSSL